MCQRPMLCVFILLVVAVGGGQGSPHLRQKLAVGGGQGSPHLRQKLAVEGGQGSPKLQQMVAPGDNVHFLGDISKVVQQNLDILAKMTRNLTSLMEDRRRENCSQEVARKEASMYDIVMKSARGTTAALTTLEASLNSLGGHITNNTCDHNTCSGVEWQCGSGECISRETYCDGLVNCLDKSDEHSNCTKMCTEEEFKCVSDSECIESSWKCDFDKDCDDGSDELNCPQEHMCTEEEFECVSDSECIESWWRCDLEKDCDDGSDELNCPIDV
ncbi:basement membrane proteoglycan-like isoform X2 [Procambarus clarkii]|uniref:basement membrane proteoglycan-like isoform X2 n=1 Tax=Procambarus clarkii TaxID=6728 RepID=UPI00374301C1